MVIEKKLKLRDTIYYVLVEVEYRKKENGSISLCMKNYKDSYYDGGDFSILLEEVEKGYTEEKALKYDKWAWFMTDILYIYNRVPFLSGIKDVYISDDPNLPSSTTYISKAEIDKYIKENNIKMNPNDDFLLMDQRTWKI